MIRVLFLLSLVWLTGCYESEFVDMITDVASDSDTLSDVVQSADSAPSTDLSEPGSDAETDSGFDLSECFSGDYIIETNADTVGFSEYPCITGSGSLQITETSLESVSLPKLRWIGGSFEIMGNEQLTIFEAPLLNEIGEQLIIENDYSLQSVVMPGLSAIGSEVVVSVCTELSTLQFLSGISEIHGDLTISYLTVSNLSGLDHLTKVDGKLQITQNWWLESFAGLEKLEVVGEVFYAIENSMLMSLAALESLVSVGEFPSEEWTYDVYFDSCSSLPYCEICALAAHLSFDAQFSIYYNGSDDCGSSSGTYWGVEALNCEAASD
ncbi:MAG: hypothetical protein JXX29_02580 [Deltaproteobacteria bacterium]|nr:hypothetical protein [Deltaproteobacteria bacterium]MBN2670527.1 hypothetical protein [Deltaproteobacteria bacterium]